MLVKQGGRVTFVSASHKPNSEIEKRRIEASGGTVSFQSSAWRVNGSLAVSRSFGDVDYQSCGVTCEPEVRSIALDGTEDFLVIGCDGLWEGLLGDDAASSADPKSISSHEWTSWVYDEVHRGGTGVVVGPSTTSTTTTSSTNSTTPVNTTSTSLPPATSPPASLPNPSEILVRKAKENGSSDNITAVFVCLRDSLAQISKPDPNVMHL